MTEQDTDPPDESLEHVRARVVAGDPDAQFNLGYQYNTGQGVPQDYAEAVRWYRLAADQGVARAQTNLGVMYDNGDGVPQDDAEAVRLWRLAADQGHASAIGLLGFKYVLGKASRRTTCRHTCGSTLRPHEVPVRIEKAPSRVATGLRA